MNKIKIFILSILSVFAVSLSSMERVIETKEEMPIEGSISLHNLPKQLKLEIIKLLAPKNSDSTQSGVGIQVHETFKNLDRLSLTNKYYYRLLREPKVIGEILLNLKKRWGYDLFQLVQDYGRESGYEWLKEYLAKLTSKEKNELKLNEKLAWYIGICDYPMVNAIVRSGAADIEKRFAGITPFLQTITACDTRFLTLFLSDKTIDVNALVSAQYNLVGYSALHLAIYELMQAKKVYQNKEEFGEKDIDDSEIKQYIERIQLLLNDPRVNVNIKNLDCETPTAFIIRLYNEMHYPELKEVLELLKSKGGHI